MPTPRVIDLSHHNSIPTDLISTKAAGVVGLIHKLTEGSGYTDDKIAARYYLAKSAGIAWGVYHFLRPGDMRQQAEFFVNKASALEVMDDFTLWVADHEDSGVSLAKLNEFCDHVDSLTGKETVIYSGHVLKDQCQSSPYPADRRLWLCHYTTGTPSLPKGCEAYWLWQYTDKGTIAGVTAPTDLNHFEGDAAAFLESWSGQPVAPPIVPEPLVVQVNINAPDGVRIEVTVNGEVV